MRVLVACEESQEVCKAFRARGHEAYSCDILPPSGGHQEWHLQEDVLNLIQKTFGEWDLVIAHPPCTYMANSGVRWLGDLGSNVQRWADLHAAMNFFNTLKYSCARVVIENPIPHKYARDGFTVKNSETGETIVSNGIGKYDQIIHPWQFGHGEKKATCLWLKGVQKLKPTEIVEGREQRIWKLPPSEDRAKLRSKTFPGIAKAMAEQWG